MADILHSIADMLDQHEGNDTSGDNMGKEASDFQHDVHDGAESADQLAIDAVQQDHKHEPELKDKPMMVPPLQQKLEIMKKLAGMPNQAEHFTAAVADEDEPVEG